MGNLLDYLAWRGDLSLEHVPFGAVDALVLSALAYVHFDPSRPSLSGRRRSGIWPCPPGGGAAAGVSVIWSSSGL